MVTPLIVMPHGCRRSSRVYDSGIAHIDTILSWFFGLLTRLVGYIFWVYWIRTQNDVVVHVKENFIGVETFFMTLVRLIWPMRINNHRFRLIGVFKTFHIRRRQCVDHFLESVTDINTWLESLARTSSHALLISWIPIVFRVENINGLGGSKA